MTSHNHNDAGRENLSALFDGELQGDAARFALKRLGQDLQWRQTCGSWQLAGDVLRGQAMAAAPRDFAGRIEAAIADEIQASAQIRAGGNATVSSSRRNWIGGAALAASVAMAALFVARPFDEPAPAAVAASQIATSTESSRPVAPPPVIPPAGGPRATIALGTAAIAAVELPRRAVERRSRGQSQRASRVAPSAATMASATAVASTTALASGGLPDASLHPFRPAPTEIISRPWPRAVLPDYPVTGAFTASYGNRAGSPDSSAPTFYPFEPRLPQGLDVATPDVPRP